MPRSELTLTINRVQGMIAYVRENLDEGEYDLFLDLILPEPEPLKAAKKGASKKSSVPKREYDHCLRCGTTKRDSGHKDTSGPDYHEFQSSKDIDFCARCKGASYVHPIHHDETLGGYHPFESSKKSGKGGSKSSRASGMAAAINRSLSQGRQAAKPDDDNDPNDHCQKQFAGGFVCNEPADANVHHLRGATGYHEFDAGKSSTSKAIPFCGKCGTRRDRPAHHDKASGDYHEFVQVNHAQPARGKPSTNGGATSGAVNSGIEREDVSNVHHAGG